MSKRFIKNYTHKFFTIEDTFYGGGFVLPEKGDRGIKGGGWNIK